MTKEIVLDAYLSTVKRMEPDICHVDVTGAAASIAISLKRIADSLEYITNRAKEEEATENERQDNPR